MAQLQNGTFTVGGTGVVLEAGKGTAQFRTGGTGTLADPFTSATVNLYELNYPLLVEATEVITLDGGSILFFVDGTTPTANAQAAGALGSGESTDLAAAATPATLTVYGGAGTLLLEEFNSEGEVIYANTIRLNKVSFPFVIAGQDSDAAGVTAGDVTRITAVGGSIIWHS